MRKTVLFIFGVIGYSSLGLEASNFLLCKILQEQREQQVIQKQEVIEKENQQKKVDKAIEYYKQNGQHIHLVQNTELLDVYDRLKQRLDVNNDFPVLLESIDRPRILNNMSIRAEYTHEVNAIVIRCTDINIFELLHEVAHYHQYRNETCELYKKIKEHERLYQYVYKRKNRLLQEYHICGAVDLEEVDQIVADRNDIKKKMACLEFLLERDADMTALSNVDCPMCLKVRQIDTSIEPDSKGYMYYAEFNEAIVQGIKTKAYCKAHNDENFVQILPKTVASEWKQCGRNYELLKKPSLFDLVLNSKINKCYQTVAANNSGARQVHRQFGGKLKDSLPKEF